MTVIATGSKGNAYALRAGSETLLLEAGVKAGVIVRAIGYDVAHVVGCLVSHEHSDHAKYAGALSAYGIDVYGTEGVGASADMMPTRFHALQPGRLMHLGGFAVVAMPTVHDVSCLAYVIRHQGMGTLLFATDTPYLDFTVRAVNHVMLEADYEQDLLEQNLREGVIDQRRHDRVVLNHMHIGTTCETLRLLDAGHTLRTATLVHPSTLNAHRLHMERLATEATGLPVRCARAGLTVEMKEGAPF